VTPQEHGAAIGAGKLDYDDFLSLPDDDKRYEILDGELAVSATPVTRHQRVSRNLEFALHGFLSTHDLGEVFDAPITVILDRHTIVVPDLVYVSKARSAIIKEKGIEGAPDLSSRSYLLRRLRGTAASKQSSTRGSASRRTGSSMRRHERSKYSSARQRPTVLRRRSATLRR
jgi:hypothetical protein